VSSAACPHNWAYDNFTNLIDSCPQDISANNTNYPKTQCCGALADMLCKYKDADGIPLVDNMQSDCATTYWATLQYAAPNITQNFFQLICTDTNSPDGIKCRNDTSNSNSNSSASNGQSFVSTILLAVMVLQILVLLF
jgi:hypothetical protein